MYELLGCDRSGGGYTKLKLVTNKLEMMGFEMMSMVDSTWDQTLL